MNKKLTLIASSLLILFATSCQNEGKNEVKIKGNLKPISSLDSNKNERFNFQENGNDPVNNSIKLLWQKNDVLLFYRMLPDGNPTGKPVATFELKSGENTSKGEFFLPGSKDENFPLTDSWNYKALATTASMATNLKNSTFPTSPSNWNIPGINIVDGNATPRTTNSLNLLTDNSWLPSTNFVTYDKAESLLGDLSFKGNYALIALLLNPPQEATDEDFRLASLVISGKYGGTTNERTITNLGFADNIAFTSTDKPILLYVPIVGGSEFTELKFSLELDYTSSEGANLENIYTLTLTSFEKASTFSNGTKYYRAITSGQWDTTEELIIGDAGILGKAPSFEEGEDLSGESLVVVPNP